MKQLVLHRCMFELMEELDGCAEEGSGCTKEVTHNVVVDQANNLLSQILDDPFLSDLPKDCNLETAKAELSLYQGKAITIHIHRYDGQTICELGTNNWYEIEDTPYLAVIVLQGATVQDLMQTFENKVEENCKKQALTTHLSWYGVASLSYRAGQSRK